MAGRRIKGEGSVYKTKGGKWVASVDLGWVNGKRKRRTFQGATQSEALRKVREFQVHKSRGLQLASENMTVGEYLTRWVAERIPGTVSARTEEIYARVIRLYLLRYLSKIRLLKLTPNDVNAMMIELGKEGLSPSTRRMARATLRRALRMAEQDGLVPRNVAAIAEGPKMDLREGRTMITGQARTFLEECKLHRLGAAYSLALTLGLRRGEIIGLKWSDIELKDGAVTLTIRRQLVRDKTGVHLSDLKTKGSRRTLHLSAPIVELLERHHQRQEAEELVRGDVWENTENLMFTSTIGTPLDPEDFGKRVSLITGEAGLGHWSIHELRHTCASLLIAAGAPLEAVSDQLGHASLHVTKDVYVHMLPGSREKTSKAMEDLLFRDYVEVVPPIPVDETGEPARQGLPQVNKQSLTRELVGRPGLDSGALGFIEASEQFDLSGDAGFVRESKESGQVVSALPRDAATVRGIRRGISGDTIDVNLTITILGSAADSIQINERSRDGTEKIGGAKRDVTSNQVRTGLGNTVFETIGNASMNCQPVPSSDKLLLTIHEAARLLAISRSKVYDLLNSDDLTSIYIGRSRRIRMSDLETFLSVGSSTMNDI
jgi:integrase